MTSRWILKVYKLKIKGTHTITQDLSYAVVIYWIVFPFKKAIYEKGLKPGGNLSILCQHEKFSHTFGKTKTEHCEKVDKVWWVFPWEYSGSFWKLTPALQTLNFWHNLCINRAATRISMLFSTDLLCSTFLRADKYPITFFNSTLCEDKYIIQ